MFYWPDVHVLVEDDESRGLFTFVRPVGDVVDERVQYASWVRLATKPGSPAAQEGWKDVWAAFTDTPWEIDRPWFQKTLQEEEANLHDNYTESKLYGVSLTINALAALSTEYEIELFRSRRGGKRRRRSRSLGGITRVRALELDPDGLSVWSKRYVRESVDTEESTGPTEPTKPLNPQSPRALHYRKATLARVWVRPENLEPGEYVEAEKVDEKTGKRYCCVFRPRKGGPVGDVVKANHQRLRSGLDDINTGE